MPPFNVYQLKITLEYVEPPIWRRVLVPGGYRLDDLHRVIQTSMGWQDVHLHQFEIDGKRYGVPDLDSSSGADLQSETRVRLDDVAPAVEDSFVYWYDFGDDWLHEVIVEAIKQSDVNSYPRCIDGARRCPPEDSGGPWQYMEIVEAFEDPSHERHGELTHWVGDEWDAEAFDLAGVNAVLRRWRR